MEIVISAALLILLTIGIFIYQKVKKKRHQKQISEMQRDISARNKKHEHKASIPTAKSNPSSACHKGYDVKNLPPSLSPDERQLIYKIASRYQIRYVTQSDIHRNIIDNLSDDFSKMPGWDMWDSSIHQASGQLDRAERGSLLSQLPNIRYDPQFQIAKVVGTSGVYLTSYKHCSCPDFRKRHLPCKHMYGLAMALDGHPEKGISNFENHPFLGLTFALAGRFPKDGNGKTVKDKIRELGGEVSENVTFHCSALVLGNSPSENKISQAKEYDMEIFTSNTLETLFQEQSELIP